MSSGRAGRPRSMRNSLPIPLCVDLDGTLVQTDLLGQAVVASLRRPRLLLGIPLWLARGRAHLKAQLGREVHLDMASLPWHRPFLAYLAAERKAGRQLVLATAADEQVAERVSAHLELFDDVIASDGIHNLKGRRKAEALETRFGRGGYCYAGNSVSDLPVWASAGHAIVVNTPARLQARVRRIAHVEAVFPRARSHGPTAPSLRPESLS